MKKNTVFFLITSVLSFLFLFRLNAQDSAGAEPAVEAGSQTEQAQVALPKSSVCEVRPSQKDPALFTIELKNADIHDLFRLLAHDYSLNILVDEAVNGTITASLTSITLEEALETIAQMNNLKIEKKGTVLMVKPDLITRTFYLKYINAAELIKQSRQTTSSGINAQGETTTTEVISEGNTIYDLLSAEGKVFSGSQGNSLVVIDYPPRVAKIEGYLEAIDTKLCTKAFSLQYISVKDLFPDLIDQERTEREKQRKERREERLEIKEIREKGSNE